MRFPKALGALALVLVLAMGALLIPAVSRPAASKAGGPAGGLAASAVTFAFAMTASPTQASAKTNVTFTITFTNSGTEPSARVWINESLPSGLAYVSDDAASVGATTGYPRFTFSVVDIGLHAFRVVGRVNVGLAPGTILTNTATLDFVDESGVVQRGLSAQSAVTVGLAMKQLHLQPAVPPLLVPGNLTPDAPTSGTISVATLKKGGPAVAFDLDVPFALPFRVVNITATLYLDTPQGRTVNVDLNLTVYDWNGASLVQVATVQRMVRTNNVIDYERVVYAFPPVDYTFPQGNVLRVQIQNMDDSDDDAILGGNALNADSRLDALTTTYVSLDTVLRRDGSGPATVWSPKDALVVRAVVSDPFGRREIQGAAINVTDPAGTPVLRSAAMTVIANGTATQTFQTTIPPPLGNGTYAIEITATEKNGVTDLWAGTAVVRAPRFTLEKTASVAQVRPNTRFTYTIWFNNTGTGPAGRVWLNDTPPSQISFLSSPNATAIPGTPIWVLTSVPVGIHWVTFDVRVTGNVNGIAFLLNTVSLNYTDEKGFLWPMCLATRDVIVNGPVLSIALGSTPAGLLHANETVVYSISLANSGDPAQTVWLNDTLPAGLTYVSDTHNPAWGSVSVNGGSVAFTFTNMDSGASWPFTLTARAPSILTRGSALTNLLSVNDTSATGVLMPPRTASLALTAASPWVAAASLAFARASVTPRDVLPLFVNVTNAGNEPARTAWINVSLDSALSFVDASVPSTVSAGVVRLTASALPVGTSTVFLNISVSASATDLQVLSANGTIAYVDGFGNPQPPRTIPATSARTALPRPTLVASPPSMSLEAGTSASVGLTLGNAGSGTASDAWLNLTLPGNFVYVSDDSDGVRSVVGSMYSWHWQPLPPGTKGFTLNLRASLAATDGSSADLLFTGDAADLNGDPQPRASANVRATFLAPTIVLDLAQSADHSSAGATLTYVLQVRNTGSTTARWVNVSDVLDGDLDLVSWQASVAMTGTARLSWNFTDLHPGAIEVIVLNVRVKDGVPGRSLIPNTAEARYSNSLGTPIGYLRSSSTLLSVDRDLMPVAYILLGGAALGAVAVLFVHRRNRVQIEEVFLVYRDGILISHLSRTMVQDKDRDSLSGMLTAVQEFVRDAFTYGEHRELHQMEFGDYHILIERGRRVYLAVVYRGRDSGSIRKKVRAALDHVEGAYGPVLEKWDGAMDEVVGTRDILHDRLLAPRSFRLFWKAP